MLKLVKYEFKKNKFILAIAAVIFTLLEGYYLINFMGNNIEHMTIGAALLALSSMVAFFLVFILGITSYNNEMKSKQGYMIFMTPNSSFKIIMSKLLYVFILGAAVVGVIGLLAIIDLKLLADKMNETFHIFEIFDILKESFGIDIFGSMAIIGIEIINSIISFMSVIVVAYFSITMSATLFQNNKSRGFISFVIFIAITLGLGYLEQVLGLDETIKMKTIMDVFKYIMPTLIFNLIVSAIAITGTTYLLDKKISL